MTFKFFTPFVSMTFSEMTEVGRFLEGHLDDYQDSYDNIIKAIQSAIKQRPSFGGFVITARKDHKTIGAIVINNTGMEGYAPQNIVVYLAVHKEFRGQGIGRQLMHQAIKTTKEELSIYVRPDQQVPDFYKDLGFAEATLELRHTSQDDSKPVSSKQPKNVGWHQES